jgi:hypothetical protein
LRLTVETCAFGRRFVGALANAFLRTLLPVPLCPPFWRRRFAHTFADAALSTRRRRFAHAFADAVFPRFCQCSIAHTFARAALSTILATPFCARFCRRRLSILLAALLFRRCAKFELVHCNLGKKSGFSALICAKFELMHYFWE